MSHGIPIVSYNCPYGPRNIITNNVEGSLVVPNDIDSFTTSIEQMILSEVKRNEFSNNAFIRSHDFLKNKVMLQWDVLFNNISNS